MSAFSYARIKVDNREVPASFHDAILKLKDATAKQWVSFDADGRYTFEKQGKRIYCAIGYLLPVTFRRQLEDSDKFVKDLPKVLGVKRHDLEVMMGVTVEDATEIQTKFDELSRSYLTVTYQKYVRIAAVKDALVENRKSWHEFLNMMLARENYAFETT